MRKMLVLGACLLFAVVRVASAAPPYDLVVSVDDAGKGSTVSASIAVTNGAPAVEDEVQSFQFHLLYDPAVLTPVSLDKAGTLSANALVDSNFTIPGTVIVAGSQGTVMSGQDVVIRVNFLVAGSRDATSSLEFVADSTEFNEGTPPIGSFSSATFTVVNTPPVIDDPGYQVVNEGSELSFTLTGSDVDEDAIEWLLDNELEGATINSETGEFSWTPNYTDAGPMHLTFYANDLIGTTSIDVAVAVMNVDTTPTLDALSDTTSDEADSVIRWATASDVDGDNLEFSASNLPPGLSMSTAGQITGTLTYVAAAGSPYTVTVTVQDDTQGFDMPVGPADIDTGTFVWTINNVDTKPAIDPISDMSNTEGTNLPSVLVGSGSDVDGDSFTFSATGLPNGLSMDASGNVSGTIAYDAVTGAASQDYLVRVTITDVTPSGSGETVGPQDSTSTTFTWGIVNTDTKPTLSAIVAKTNAEGEVISTTVSGSDVDGDALVYSATGLPTGLTMSTSGEISGTISYDAFTGTAYTVAVTVSDAAVSPGGPSGDTDAVTFIWTIESSDTQPVLSAIADQLDAEGDAPELSISAIDEDGDNIAYSATGLPPGVILSGTTIAGTLPYDAAVGSPYSVKITATDNTPSGPGATVGPDDSTSVYFTWTVDNVDTSPSIASPGDQSGTESDAVNFTLSGNDVDADAVSYSATNLPDGISIAGDGTVSGVLSYDAANGSPYTTRFIITDDTPSGPGATVGPQDSSSVAITWTVADNPRPVSVVVNGGTSRTVTEQSSLYFLVGGDDPDGGSLELSATGVPTGASWNPATGEFNWTPDYNAAAGSPYEVTFTATFGVKSADGVVTITVTDVPRDVTISAVPSGSQTIAENEQITVNVSGDDPDGGSISLSATGVPSGASWTPGSGVFSWTPDYDAAAGSPYTVIFTARSGAKDATESVIITVTNVVRAPVLTVSPRGAQTVSEANSIAVNVSSTSPEGTLVTLAATGVPTAASWESSDGTSATGTFSWTTDYDDAPASPYTVVFTATSSGVSTKDSVVITVTDVPRALNVSVSGGASQTVAEQGTLNISVSGDDPDGGSVTLSATGVPSGASWTPASGEFLWTPDYTAAAGSPYEVIFTATSGTKTANETITITVTDVPRDVTISAVPSGSQTIAENEQITVNVSGDDPDGGSLTLSATGVPAGASWTPETGVFSWTPNYDAATGSPYSVEFTATSGMKTASETVTITVTNVVRAPVLTVSPRGAQTVSEANSIAVNVSSTSPEGTSVALTVTGVPTAANWESSEGTSATGTFSWTTDYDDAPASPYTVVFTATSSGVSTKDSVVITVTDVQRELVFTLPGEGELTANEDEDFDFALTATDPDGGTVTITATGVPTGANWNGETERFTWTPGFDDAGTYPIVFTASVPDVKSDTRTVTLTVVNVNRPPQITHIFNFPVTVAEGGELMLGATGSDPDGDPLTYSAVFTTDMDSSSTVDGDSYSLTLTPGYDVVVRPAVQKEITITLQVSDGEVTIDALPISLTVQNTNRAPVLTEIPAQTVTEGKTLALVVDATDPDGDPLYLKVSPKPEGAAVVELDRSFTWPTKQIDVGVHNLTFSVWDRKVNVAKLSRTGIGGDMPQVATQEVQITVVDTNYAPVVQAIPDVQAQVNKPMQLSVRATDADGDSLVFSDNTDLFDIEATGIIRFTPVLKDTGTHEITITVADTASTPATSSTTFTLTVTKDKTPPYIISLPAVEGISTNSATVTWKTNEPATSVVRYGLVGGPLSEIESLTALVTDHAVPLTGLTPDRTYNYEIRSLDDVENSSAAMGGSFTTLPAVVTIPLSLEGRIGVNRGSDYALITWNTNRYSSTEVRYGLTEALGTVEIGQAGTNHNRAISPLEPNTVYFYQVHSVDAQALTYTSETESFTTKPGVQPVVITEGPSVNALSDSSFAVTWTTDRAAITIVEYGFSSAYGGIEVDSALVTTHHITLTKLSPVTEYHFRAGSNGPEKLFDNTYSSDQTVYTLATPDRKAPVITEEPSAPAVNHQNATVKWVTDESSNSIVQFGEDAEEFAGYTREVKRSSDYVNTHTITLSDLAPSTTYRYKVMSYDVVGNGPTTEEATFITTSQPDTREPTLIGTVKVISVTDKGATVTWVTDEPSHSLVYFDDGEYEDEVEQPDLVNVHKIPLTGLTAQTTYSLRIFSSDNSDNTLGPLDAVFTTTAEPDRKAPAIVGQPFVKGQKLKEDVDLVDVVLSLATDELASIVTHFGFKEDSLVGQLSATDRNILHTLQFTNLPPDTKVHYRMVITDAAEVPNTLEDEVRNFVTRALPDRTPPKVTRPAVVTDRQTTSLRMEWVTDEAANSVMQLGLAADALDILVEDQSLKTQHALTATNLTPDTRYYWRISSRDGSKNRAVGKLRSTKTLREPDTVHPVIIEGPLTSPSGEAVTFTLKSDENAQVEVYLAPEGGAYTITYAEVEGTRHSITITGLTVSTQYHSFIRIIDGAGNYTIWGEYDRPEFSSVPFLNPSKLSKYAKIAGGRRGAEFSTAPTPDQTFPVITTAPRVANATTTDVTVEWTTDELSNSVVRVLEASTDATKLGQSAEDLASALLDRGRTVGLSGTVLDHQMTIADLIPGTRYVLHVASTDVVGNGETVSGLVYVTTSQEADLAAPVIVDGSINVVKTQIQAVITWETDELATSTVEYGTFIGSLDQQRTAQGQLNSHAVTLTNLSASTTYHYRVSSTDASGNGPTRSGIFNFTTEAVPDMTPPVVTSMNIVSISDRSATVSWVTNELADTGIEYGESASFGLTYTQSSPSLSHTATLTNLNKETTYYFRISAADPAGNTTTAARDSTFATIAEADTEAPLAPAAIDTTPASNRILLSWQSSASLDIASYAIYRDGEVLVTGVSDTSYMDQTVDNGTRYSYRIAGVDFAGNAGDQSVAVFETPSASEAPTAPPLVNPLTFATENLTLTFVIDNANRATSRPTVTPTYSFVVASDSLLTNIILSQASVPEGTSGQTAWKTDGANFEVRSTYFWVVQANDGVAISPMSTVGSFLWSPTSVELESFSAEGISGVGVKVAWKLRLLGSEIDRVELVRGETADGLTVKTYGSEGVEMTMLDALLTGTANYWLRVSFDGGRQRTFGPVEAEALMPRQWALSEARPNPFNPSTTVILTVPENADARLVIFNILGQPVRTLHTGPINAGIHRFVWNGFDNVGRDAASGVYIMRLRTQDGPRMIRKLTLVR
jgi:hypothetical protein